MSLQTLIKTTKTFKLLYVEDDAVSRLSVTELLDNFFDDVTVAIDGEDGLKKFKENDFDIILSDINMPKLNGVDMLTQIRKLDKDVSVVFLTANNDNEYLADAIRLSVDSFIIKPLGLQNLSRTLSKISEKILLKKDLNSEEILKKLGVEEFQGFYFLEHSLKRG